MRGSFSLHSRVPDVFTARIDVSLAAPYPDRGQALLEVPRPVELWIDRELPALVDIAETITQANYCQATRKLSCIFELRIDHDFPALIDVPEFTRQLHQRQAVGKSPRGIELGLNFELA